MLRRLLPAVCLALVTPMLSACGLFGGGDHLSDALDVTPASATSIQFFDRERAAERLDITDADADAYLDAVEDSLDADDAYYSGTPLYRWIKTMAGTGVSERDVVWSIDGLVSTTESSGTFQTYKIDDDVDLDDVAADMVDAGYRDDEADGRHRLTIDTSAADPADGTFGGRYPFDWTDVALIPEEHLLIVGSAIDEVLATVDDDTDSLTDADTLDDLLDGVDDVEVAVVDASGTCYEGDGQSPADQGFELASPNQSAFFLIGDDLTTSARLLFDDDGVAEADASARHSYLGEGTTVESQLPNADIGTFEVESDGALVTIEMDLDQQQGEDLARRHDAFAACGG